MRLKNILERLPISVIVLTHNEETHISPCLTSVIPWAGEVNVVDSGSTDRTLEIVSQFTNKVFFHPFSNYSNQRNWAQSNLALRYDWVFHIDSDERVSFELAAKLRQFFEKRPNDHYIMGILIRRRIEFMGRHIRHGGIYPTYHCRIFHRDKGRCEDRDYDQHFIVTGPTIKIEADLIESTAASLFSWTARHNRWAQMEVTNLMQKASYQGRHQVSPKLLGSPIERRRWLRNYYEKGPLFIRAFLYFFVRYIFRGGFLDGIPGLVYHVLHGFWFRFYIDACYYEKRNIDPGEIS